LSKQRDLLGDNMTNIGEIYTCRICGNTVEVIGPGAGRLVCCGQEMELAGNADDNIEAENTE
jgi:superoxide reductase